MTLPNPHLNELLNNRELAIAIWSSLFVFCALTEAKIRKSLWNVAVALWNKSIRRVLALTAVYIAAIIYVLESIQLWDIQHAKLTILWAISVAVVMVFRGVKHTGDPHYFRRSVLDLLKVTILIEFVFSLYSFNLWVELTTVPLIAIVVAMQAYSEGKEEYSNLQFPLQFVLTVYAIALVTFTIHRIVSDFDGFATADHLREFILPPIMSLAFLPFMYPLLIYLAYEQVLSRISFSLPDKLLRFAKRRALIRFRGDRVLLQRWARIISYQDIKTRRQLKESIDRAKLMQLREQRPLVVIFESGWSPANSRLYLAEKGVVAGYYEPSVDGSWRASSEYFELRDMSAVLCNNIAYYLQGTAKYVLHLKLVLNVNDLEDATRSHNVFLDFCDQLALSSLKVELDPEVREALKLGRTANTIQRERQVGVERHDWVNSADGGYEIIFTIRHPSFEGMKYVPWLHAE